ncbi:MAG: META domain-containing protein [Mangrovibacterium sp.]
MKQVYPLFLATMILASCSSVSRKMSNITEVSQLEGEWSFLTVNGEKVENERAYVAFVDGKRVGGSSGCNNFSGAMEFDGKVVSIGEIMATRKMCPNMEFEQQITQLLAKSQWKAQVSADTLVLTQVVDDSMIELVKRLPKNN